MVILSGHIQVAADELDSVRAALPEHIRLTESESGCITFRVTEVDNGRFDVYEEFVDREAFEAHQQRVRASDWGAVTVNVTRHYEITDR